MLVKIKIKTNFSTDTYKIKPELIKLFYNKLVIKSLKGTNVAEYDYNSIIKINIIPILK